jgi:DNA-binding CsgD family transcriptional regulator
VTLRWGLVGRDKELDLLRTALAEVDARGVVLFGAPGVGKTRLAAELLDHAAGQGWRTEWVVGTRGISGVPFGAFAHLLAPSDLAPSDLAPSDLAPSDLEPSDLAATSSGGLLQRIGERFCHRNGNRPIVLVVDDAHLLDDASADLTHLLASSARVFVVATVRHGERVPDAISALCKDGLAERVEVPALSRKQVGQLLGGVLGGQLDTATQYRLWDASRGNVLFLQELVLTGLERGHLAERAGVWSWAGELACSDRLAELVADQLVGLSRQQRCALEVLAIGEPLPSALFDSLVGTAVVQHLHGSGLLGAARQGQQIQLRVAHPLYAAAIRAGLGVVRRRSIFRQLADALGTMAAPQRQDVLRASLWRLESGGSVDPAMLLAGARQARASCAHQLAERLARAAIDEGAGTDARVVLAEALHWQGRDAEACLAVGNRPPLDAGPAGAAEWAMVASAVFFWGLGDADRAEEIVRCAEQITAAGPEHDLLVAQRARLAFFHARPADAWAAVEPLLSPESASDLVLMAARVAAVPALAALGRCDAALKLADEATAAAAKLRDPQPQLVGELPAMQVLASWMAGRYRQMEDLAAASYQQVTAEQAHDLRGLWAMLLGRAALAAGRARTARQHLREACALLRQQDPGGLLACALGAQALAAALLGDVEEAERALVGQRRSQLPAVRVFDWEAVLAQAWTAVARGEHSTARSLACRAADVAAASGLCTGELLALHDALRLGEIRVAPRLAALAGVVDSALAPVIALHATALATGDADALERCAAGFAELGAVLLAAEAAAEAAEQHHRAGHLVARLAARERCREWASRCEGARTPSLRRAGDPRALDALTTREREIAELAARGLPKREIAERLALSARTVGNHLNHIYSKTGVSGRAELALLLPWRSPARGA